MQSIESNICITIFLTLFIFTSLIAKLDCAEGETIHNKPFNVTSKKIFYTLKTMDAIDHNKKIKKTVIRYKNSF
ncbi:MAG: hypothetical protein IMY72_12315 [Bacteroidetes bacterium]|nr:hypothetical protein [Bacteroidota bacterium]